MKIVMKTSIAGAGFSHRPGDVVDWPDAADAANLVKRGYAAAAAGHGVRAEAIDSDVARVPEIADPPVAASRGKGK